MTKKKSVRLLVGFVAGFVSVLLFHQGVLALLNSTGFIQVPPYSLQPTKPLGVPKVLNSAFWGGVWGIGLSLVAFRIQQTSRYWPAILLFGALAPTAVALFVVMPLKGMPVAGGWQPNLIATGLMVNGAWAAGVAIALRGLFRKETNSKAPLD